MNGRLAGVSSSLSDTNIMYKYVFIQRCCSRCRRHCRLLCQHQLSCGGHAMLWGQSASQRGTSTTSSWAGCPALCTMHHNSQQESSFMRKQKQNNIFLSLSIIYYYLLTFSVLFFKSCLGNFFLSPSSTAAAATTAAKQVFALPGRPLQPTTVIDSSNVAL